MRRLLCRLSLHRWRAPTTWITFKSEGETHVKGVEKCERRDCRAVRDYYKTWSPKVETVGRVRRSRDD